MFFMSMNIVVFSQDCGLIIPLYPLTSNGLMHPYILTPLDFNSECNIDTVSIKATILDLDSGKLSIVYPIVIDSTDNNNILSNVKPKLPTNHIISLWFYTTADTITLLNPTQYVDTLKINNCMNSKPNILHGQFAYCNAIEFFIKVSNLIYDNKIFLSSFYKNHIHQCKNGICRYDNEYKHQNYDIYNENYRHELYDENYRHELYDENYSNLDIILTIGNFIIDLWDRIFVRQ